MMYRLPSSLSLFYLGTHSNRQVKAIEKHIDLGQIEEVIESVKDEIKLTEIYIGEFIYS
jgi:hypothetical protein